MPGMADHALPLKTVGDAMHIRNTVLRRLARIELESDAALRRALGHFVIIGGGFSGVAVAGELVDCLRSIRRYYPRIAAFTRSHELQADEARRQREHDASGAAASRPIPAVRPAKAA